MIEFFYLDMKLKFGDVDSFEYEEAYRRNHDYEIIAKSANFEPDEKYVNQYKRVK